MHITVFCLFFSQKSHPRAQYPLPSTSEFSVNFPGPKLGVTPVAIGSYLNSSQDQKHHLDGGSKYFLFSPLFGEDSHFDEHIFQMG